MKFLIVEDNPEVIDMLVAMLYSVVGSDNCHISTGHNGHEGLAQVQNNPPDIILTNLRMPLMDGMAFISEVRQRREWDYIQVVMMSALNSADIRREAQSTGVTAFLQKPFTIRDLRQYLNSLS